MSVEAKAVLLAGVAVLVGVSVPLQLAVPMIVLVVAAGAWLMERDL